MTLEDFHNGRNNFGQAARVCAGDIAVGFAKHEVQEITDGNEEINLANMPGIHYYDDDDTYMWYRQYGTGYRSIYYPQKGLLVDENSHYSRENGFSNIEIKVTKDPKKYFAEYISALNDLSKEAKNSRKAFAKEVFSLAKARGFYSKKSTVSAMALALEWEREELPRLESKVVKKVMK